MVQRQVIVKDAPGKGRFKQDQVARCQPPVEIAAQRGEVVFLIGLDGEVIVRAVAHPGQQRQRHQHSGGALPASYPGQPRAQQQDHAPADQAHVPRVHVGRVDLHGDAEHRHRPHDERRGQPAACRQHTPRAHAAQHAHQRHRAKEQVQPPHVGNVHAQPQAEGVEQVGQEDRPGHVVKIGPAAVTDDDRPVGKCADASAQRQRQRARRQRPCPAAPPQPYPQQQPMHGQQKDRIIVAGEKHAQRDRVAPPPAPDLLRGARETVGADQRHQRPQRIGPRLLPVPEKKGVHRGQQRRPQCRARRKDPAPREQPPPYPDRRDKQRHRHDRHPAQHKLTRTRQPHQDTLQHKEEERVLVMRHQFAARPIVEDQLACQQPQPGRFCPLQAQALIPPEVFGVQRPGSTRQRQQRNRQQRRAHPARPSLFASRTLSMPSQRPILSARPRSHPTPHLDPQASRPEGRTAGHTAVA